MTESIWKRTACILCECNCGIEVQTEGRNLTKIRGDKTHPASQGYACEKAQRLGYYQGNPDRLTTPLRRTPAGTFEPISWDVAIAEISAKLGAIRDTHGGDKIFFYAGGGQGNHLGRVYASAFQAALGSRYYSNALAQEKTGEIWVDGRMYGAHTKGDFEHAEVVMFIGKNPWQSHSFPRSRPVLKELAADPDRAMIVIDPRLSETAAMADFHLQVRPGTDAWCLAALGAVIVQEDLIDHDFIAKHTTGVDAVLAELGAIDVSDYADRCGVDETLLRAAAQRFATAKSACTYEDLGVQQAPNSTLSSYLNKLLWILTGNFARRGTMFVHSSFVPLAGSPPTGTKRTPSRLDRIAKHVSEAAVKVAAPPATQLAARMPQGPAAWLAHRFEPLVAARTKAPGAPAGGRTSNRTPVTGARIIAGLIPANSIVEEIVTDHPDRFRALWLDSTNPVHSLAGSAGFREAMETVDLAVVVDVAMTETARLADYVLPASSQFEKWEATFFNVDFPDNVFHLRRPVVAAEPGTLPEAEIYARLIRALDVVPSRTLAPLRRAARAGRDQFAIAFFAAIAGNPALLPLAPYLLYETLGPTLEDGAQAAAALWGVSHTCAMTNRDALARAGFSGTGFEPGERLFDALVTGEAQTFTSDAYADTWNYVRRRDRRFTVEIPELLGHLRGLQSAPSVWTSSEFPLVLMAGERRSYTANTIIRDPQWRKRDAEGALRISVRDAEARGLETGSRVRIVTKAGAAETVVEVSGMMQSGHVSLPNGFGLDVLAGDGTSHRTGVALNDLTSVEHRDFLAGTPWHKYVPARIELLDGQTAPVA